MRQTLIPALAVATLAGLLAACSYTETRPVNPPPPVVVQPPAGSTTTTTPGGTTVVTPNGTTTTY